MRRLLRDVAEGRNLGDTTTLADAAVVDELQRRAQSGRGDGERGTLPGDQVTLNWYSDLGLLYGEVQVRGKRRR